MAAMTATPLRQRLIEVAHQRRLRRGTFGSLMMNRRGKILDDYGPGVDHQTVP